jgi:hypothetical protein
MNAYAPQAHTLPGVDSRQTAMATRLYLAPVGNKAVDLDCDGGLLAAEAGLLRRNDPAEPRGFTRARAAGRKDPRAPRRVHFPWQDLLTQRVWHMAAGDEAANDANPLRPDPLCQLLLER